jgi:hypothetical protein
MFQQGQEVTFTYPAAFSGEGCAYPDHVSHSGQRVRIVCENPDHELYDGETETVKLRLFTVEASDGWRGDAWEEELAA